MPRNSGLVAALGALAVLAAGLTWFATSRGNRTSGELTTGNSPGDADQSDIAKKRQGAQNAGGGTPPVPPFEDDFHTIFDGTSTAGWILNTTRGPLPRAQVQKDGLNPHGTGSYLVVYQEKLSDFELDFDYKLEKGCNSGVFLRVSNLANPIFTAIEIALNDRITSGFGASGAIFSLVAAEGSVQKPAGQSNHMTIKAQGPEITVVLNGSTVSSINLDEWKSPGKRPDGTPHDFKGVAIADLPRTGYFGFQNLVGNCWFNHIRVKKLSPPGVSSPGAIARKTTPVPTETLIPAAEPYAETARYVGHAHRWVESVHATPDGKRLLSTGADKTARLWDIASGRELLRFWHPASTRSAAIHRDGRLAVTACDDGFVRLWDLESGKLVRPLARHASAAYAVCLSPDGTHALSGGNDKTLRILNVEKGGEVRQFEGISSPIWAVAFSPDGRRVLAGGVNGAVYLGDTMTSDPVRMLTGHSDRVWDIAFTPDGRHAVSSGADGRLIYWDLDAKRAERQAKLKDDEIRCLALDQSGSHAIFGTQHGSAEGQATGVLGNWEFTADGPARSLAAGPAFFGLALLPHGGVATADAEGFVGKWEPAPAIARARQLKRTGKPTDALLEYDRAVADRPDDPRLLIERGRLLATTGQAQKAAADFEAAARIAPDDPQLFLDAGWWAAGPYRLDFSQAGALEKSTSTDPSLPAPSLGSEPKHWHEIVPGMRGQVNFEKLFKADDVVAYAMTVVYSTRPSDAVLLIGTDDAGRIWLNGREVFFSPTFSPADAHAIFANLQTGRNTIVARVRDFTSEHTISLRFSDSPFDLARAFAHSRKWKEASEAFAKATALDPQSLDPDMLGNWARSLAESERWKEAKEAFEKIAALDPGNFDKQQTLSRCYMALDDRRAYERLCEAAIARHGKTTNPNLINNLVWLVALMPDAVRNYTDVLNIGRTLVNHRNPDPNNCNTYGAVSYRAGNYSACLTYHKRSLDAKDPQRNAFDWIFTAMARHKSRQPDAPKALASARAIIEGLSTGSWEARVELQTLLKEAERTLALPPPR